MSISDFCNVPVVVNAVRWEAASGGHVPFGAVCGGKTMTGEVVYIGRTKLKENHDELTPGVVIPSESCLIVSFGTGVRTSSDYEVLVTGDPCFLHWVSCKFGQVPPNAVIGGIDCSYLEPLYIGRTSGDLSGGRTWRGQRFPSKIIEDDAKSNTETQETASIPEKSFRKSNAVLHDRNGLHESFRVKVSFPGKVHRSHKCLYIPFNDKEYIFREYEVLTLTSSPAALRILTKCLIRDHLLKLTQATETGKRLRSTGSTFELMQVEKKIDMLPLPSKLKQFCKNDM